jgi:hypothetical protein
MMSLNRWFYRGGRPNLVARVLNRGGAAVYALGVAPNYLVTLEVPGRRSGRVISFPLVMVVVEDERYLVSMLGEDVNWVRDLKAANNEATLRHGRREQVRLEPVAPDLRAPVLKAYLQRAPGARPHLPIDKDAPLAEFEEVASRFPVFRVVPMEREIGAPGSRRPSVQPPVEPRASRAASRRSAAVFAIKLVHSLIFLSIAASILQVFYAGITNRSSRWTTFSLTLAVGECLVFAGNRFRCPLTGLAESLGAESGQVTDIFLPRWLADRIPWIFTPPLIAGILALLWHHWHPAGTRTSPQQPEA